METGGTAYKCCLDFQLLDAGFHKSDFVEFNTAYCRKAQRAKEIARNKKERKFQRDAHSLQANPDAIKDELKEVLALEEDGKGNQTVRLKKKALQGAYDNAIKKKKVSLASKDIYAAAHLVPRQLLKGLHHTKSRVHMIMSSHQAKVKGKLVGRGVATISTY